MTATSATTKENGKRETERFCGDCANFHRDGSPGREFEGMCLDTEEWTESARDARDCERFTSRSATC